MKRLFLWGEITSESAEPIVREILSSSDDIDLFICSQGGDYDCGLAIIDAMILRENQIKIRTIGIGRVYSSAAFIFCFGHTRLSTPNATYNFHQFSYALDDNFASRQHDYAAFAKRQLGKFGRLLSQKLGWAPGRFTRFVQRDRWMGVEEAMRAGIIQDVYNKLETQSS